jgi:flagellar basal body-associated protein FliL
MAEEQQETIAPAPKGLPIKTIAVVTAIMFLEAGGVYVFMRMTGRTPEVASATLMDEDQNEDTPVEVQLIAGTYTNLSTNQNWMWEIDIYLKVRRRNEELVNKTLERRKAEIAEGVGLIIRKAQHAHLKEPELLTIQRQLGALVSEIFGSDPDGAPRVERVMIAKCTGLPVH